jgi:hypothetical protein
MTHRGSGPANNAAYRSANYGYSSNNYGNNYNSYNNNTNNNNTNSYNRQGWAPPPRAAVQPNVQPSYVNRVPPQNDAMRVLVAGIPRVNTDDFERLELYDALITHHGGHDLADALLLPAAEGPEEEGQALAVYASSKAGWAAIKAPMWFDGVQLRLSNQGVPPLPTQAAKPKEPAETITVGGLPSNALEAFGIVKEFMIVLSFQPASPPSAAADEDAGEDAGEDAEGVAGARQGVYTIMAETLEVTSLKVAIGAGNLGPDVRIVPT